MLLPWYPIAVHPSRRIAMVVFFVATTVAAAADEIPQRLRGLLEAQVQAHRAFKLPDRIEVEYLQWTPPAVMSAEEHAALVRLAEVEANARLRLRQHDREMELGGNERRTTLFYADPTHWRTNTDLRADTILPYSDLASGKEGSWSLNERQMQYTADGSSQDGFDPASRKELLETWLAMATTGIPWPPEADFEPVRAEETDAGVVYLLQDDKDVRIRLSGVIEKAGTPEARLLISTVELARAPGEPFVVTTRFEGWDHNGTLGRPVAHTITEHTQGGAVLMKGSLLRLGPLTHDIDAITKRPTADGHDPFRGPATFASVIDHGKGRESQVGDDRALIESLPRDAGGGPRRLVGLLAAVAAMLALLLAGSRTIRRGTP